MVSERLKLRPKDKTNYRKKGYSREVNMQRLWAERSLGGPIAGYSQSINKECVEGAGDEN